MIRSLLPLHSTDIARHLPGERHMPGTGDGLVRGPLGRASGRGVGCGTCQALGTGRSEGHWEGHRGRGWRRQKRNKLRASGGGLEGSDSFH